MDNDDEYLSTLVNIGDKQIENVKQFIYLGAAIRYNESGTSNKELDRRIGLAHGKFAGRVTRNYSVIIISCSTSG